MNYNGECISYKVIMWIIFIRHTMKLIGQDIIGLTFGYEKDIYFVKLTLSSYDLQDFESSPG